MPKQKNWTADEVHQAVTTYMNPEHVAFVDKAYEYAASLHKDQVRKSGEPYIIHPIQVAGILAQLHMDPETIVAGYLHDVVEDTDATIIDLQHKFGDNVALIVNGVTKLGKIEYKSSQEQLAENHRKLLLAMSKDIRVIIVKLSDRLHNMRTLQHLRPEKQRRISAETLEIYAPLADRLGISTIKWELEDTALRYLNPEQYHRIAHLMDSRRDERLEYIRDAIDYITNATDELGYHNIKIYGRPKHIYSVYRKMVDKKKKFDEIYDLLAIRIEVNTIPETYAVLGIIHSKWTPIPGRFKDYIALPKANGYQSLHTTVIGPEGKRLEIQIRTHEMHRIAEYGVAAHWAYKEGNFDGANVQSNDQQKLNMIQGILELQKESKDADDFMDSVKGDLFTDRVFAFTPKGDVYELPKGAGPLDMAYTIHTEIGHKTTGARVNGKMVPLNYELKTGDIVEIITSNTARPSRDWFNIVSTRRARNKIRQYFRKQNREENIEAGKTLIIDFLQSEGFNPEDILTEENEERTISKLHVMSIPDMFAALGFGDLAPQGVANKLTEIKRAEMEADRIEQQQRELLEEHKQMDVSSKFTQKRSNSSSEGVMIQGVDGLLVRLSHCCTPIPGDEIVGYITKGRGVSVHRADCPNIRDAERNGQRLIEVSWENPEGERPNYDADLTISGNNRNGLLNDVIKIANNNTKYLTSVNGRVDHNGLALISLSVGVRNKIHLDQLMNGLNNIPDVYDVKRAQH
ncbi:RelA/SpoT family protein [Periweissella fabalis]|uniref:GTP diphosphokinase n=1 Tax=Periweissella fabalis TaxID=1070421 RepID=A0A7X6S3H1_9LACO|nr:bifunctional (p)ppGpp synthetase/guanosine-3',5'-bis(diphosphate) 3'-pyrophosphohydrolase [Periweissella fabalis]MCM0598798.1 bifunctional (p)ppGpp synthetase/guanosine-3',5'-bis(diphosphate) 3'-pyrophosphohydrolase [Periweissella fabalis]NKZ24603.1 bifunctional (p)ppGpp synthetase/guanosine-3',5'-bis(diphosphate) 3'-pyrophosphohydrolase [Periweissella fabalis]